LSASELDAVSQKLARCYREFAASGTHAAAEWAIRRWQLPLPAVDSSVNVSRDWGVNSVGIMMVKVPPTDWKSPTDPPSFWLSDREISRRVFQAFVDDPNWPATAKPVDWPGADPERSPSQDHPVQNVSWIDAVLLCNWLSNREGREASYVSDGMAWQLVAGANGYRLPTEAEWEFACRARTTTEFVSGNDERFLESYAVYRSNQTAICGSKMPNPWGLFDMHGNVYEWCQDWFFPNSERSLRSGAFDYSSSKSRSSNRQSNVETYRSFTIGIRIARSGD
jgi:sulfatase modifying factor 1